MSRTWVICRSVLNDLGRESVLDPHYWLVEEVGEGVGRGLVLDDQSGGDGQQARGGLQTSL